MGDVSIDAGNFCTRLKNFYDAWQASKSTLWGGVNAVAVPVGASSDDLRYLKSISLHLWLLGYELPDTVLLFTASELHVLTSQKKANLLEPLSEECSKKAGVKLVLHSKPKSEDGSAQIRELLQISQKEAGSTIGCLPKEKHEGKFYELWTSMLGDSGLTQVDVAAGFADLLSCKDPAEILNVKKAALLASKVMSGFVVQKIEQIIDDEKKVKHSKLSEQTEEVITDPAKCGIKLKAENVDIAYPPLFQSGGKYDLKVSASCDDTPLHDGVIVVALGTRYSSYCANVGRTYLVNPSQKQEQEYAALLAAQEAAIAALLDGAPMSNASEAVVRTLQAKKQQHLVAALSKTAGFGMGLEFRESANVLSAKNENVVKPGMVFNVCVGVQGLENPSAKDSKGKVYAFQIADTVIVQEGGKAPEVVTNQCPKHWDKISYTLQDDEEEEEMDEKKPDVKLEEITNGVAPSKKNLRFDDPNYKSAEQLRKEKQEALLLQKNEETLRRLTAKQQDGAGGDAGGSGRNISDLQAYRAVNEIPQSSTLSLQVDSKAESVLVPIYGIMVPFHITTIKNVTSNQDNDHAYIRVTFNFSGNFEPALRFPNAVFLKELSFRSSDLRHASKVVQDIKLLRSTVSQRDKERAERATLVQQEKLVKGKRVYRLPDLWVRPGFGGKGRKMPGTLEAHQNGFRYTTPKGETVDVMFSNIKHAFFQPAENEMITILHFHLIHPIMINAKKTKDVQFYAEVMDVVQTLDGGRRSMYDPDEIEEEQRERDRRNKINQEFQQFFKRVQEHWEREFADMQLEFDIPFKELGFDGVPHRSTVRMYPTVNCLIELTEMPFTVIALEEIEIVNLERVGFNLKNFDMAIVFKDFHKDVLRIDAIPAKSLDTIKEWLTSVKIKYYESKMNLAWKPVLKNIQEDPVGFFEQGGWSFLDVDKSDSEDEESEQSEDFEPEESEEAESSEDISSDDASLVDSDDEGSGDYSGSDEEEEDEGLSWEELEEEAKRADKDRGNMSDDSEDERRNKKRKSTGANGGNAAAKRRR